jgi:YHS domain-containing protein
MLWLIRLILILLLLMLVIRAVWRLVGGIVEGASARRGVPQRGTRMVRDPVCGTFVVQSRALTATAGGETAWFCSNECLTRWKAEHR